MNSIQIEGSIGITNSSTLTSGKIDTRNIDLDKLRKELFPEPKVVKEPPPTIEQLTAAAYSRLHVFIDAEFRWLSVNLKKEFQKAIYDLDPIGLVKYDKDTWIHTKGSFKGMLVKSSTGHENMAFGVTEFIKNNKSNRNIAYGPNTFIQEYKGN